MTLSNLGDQRLNGSADQIPTRRLAGPAELPYKVAGEAAAVDRLRHHLRSSLSEQLSQRIRSDEASGRPPMDAQQRRRFAEAILTDAAEVVNPRCPQRRTHGESAESGAHHHDLVPRPGHGGVRRRRGDRWLRGPIGVVAITGLLFGHLFILQLGGKLVASEASPCSPSV